MARTAAAPVDGRRPQPTETTETSIAHQIAASSPAAATANLATSSSRRTFATISARGLARPTASGRLEDGLREAKVGHLERQLVTALVSRSHRLDDEDVGGLEVAMYDTVRVQVLDCRDDLSHEARALRLCKATVGLVVQPCE